MYNMMKINFLFIYCILFIEACKQNKTDNSSSNVVSRKRRYVAFPEGSSFTVAICTTIGVIGNPNVNFLSYALNWGVAYDLPNETWILAHANGFKTAMSKEEPIIKRTFRRDLYEKMKIAIESMGYNGKDCILKALCESSKRFIKKGRNMVEELIRTIFSFPNNMIYSHEHNDIHEYDRAYRYGRDMRGCESLYLNCQFSILDLALGKYSIPPLGYM